MDADDNEDDRINRDDGKDYRIDRDDWSGFDQFSMFSLVTLLNCPTVRDYRPFIVRKSKNPWKCC